MKSCGIASGIHKRTDGRWDFKGHWEGEKVAVSEQWAEGAAAHTRAIDLSFDFCHGEVPQVM